MRTTLDCERGGNFGLKAAYERFLELEEVHALFHQAVHGVLFWERIRFSVWSLILTEMGLIGQPHTKISRTLGASLRDACGLIGNALAGNPYMAPNSELMFVGHPRRKLREDGLWWDIYCDPVIEHLNKSYAYFESAHLGKHLSPAKTQHRYHLEFISRLAGAGRELRLMRVRLDAKEIGLLRSVRESIKQCFGVDVPLEDLVARSVLARRKGELPLYRQLLKRVAPALVIVVVSYGKETLIEACKSLGIPVVELQHGVISPYHLGYSFPGEHRTKETFPDYLFLFGDYWREGIEYPIAADRLVPVGYPYLEEEMAQWRPREDRNRVLFISQGTIGKELSQVAVELSKVPGLNQEILYKLHPGEQARWRQEYPWLVGADVKVIAGDSVTLYRLFSKAQVQVGVYSTALYEGLAFGLRTCLLGLPGVEYMEPLVEKGLAVVCRSAHELATSAGNADDGGPPSQVIGQLFRPHALDNAKSWIEAIRRGEAP